MMNLFERKRPVITSKSPQFKVAALISLLTVVVTLSVAYAVNGSFFETVLIVDLARWGGVTWSQLSAGEIWRIATAQLVHVKIPHMFFNAICLFLVGTFVEKVAGARALLAVWLFAGGAATVISPIPIDPPYNVGTGASHAVLALGGFAAVLLTCKERHSSFSIGVTILAIVPPFLIDFAFVGYPKLGHLAGLLFGCVLGVVWRFLYGCEPSYLERQSS